MIRGGTIAMSDKPVKFERAIDEEPAAAIVDDDVDNVVEERNGQPDASNARGVKAQRQKQKNIEAERRMVLDTLLQHDAGSRFLAWVICDLAAIFGATINATLDRPFSQHREGQRSVGLVLHAECLHANADRYMKALQNNLTQGMTK